MKKKKIQKAIKEYYRVLKTGGLAFIVTTSKKHTLFKSSKKIKKNHYICQNYDFRNNEKFFFFENKKQIRDHFKKFFKIKNIGETYYNFNNEIIGNYIFSIEKK